MIKVFFICSSLLLVGCSFYTSKNERGEVENSLSSEKVNTEILTKVKGFLKNFNLKLNLISINYEDSNLIITFQTGSENTLRCFEFDEYFMGILSYRIFRSFEEVSSISVDIIYSKLLKDDFVFSLSKLSKKAIENTFNPDLDKFTEDYLMQISPEQRLAIIIQYQSIVKDWHPELGDNFFFMLDSYLKDCKKDPKESLPKQALTLTGYMLRENDQETESEIISELMNYCGIDKGVWDNVKNDISEKLIEK